MHIPCSSFSSLLPRVVHMGVGVTLLSHRAMHRLINYKYTKASKIVTCKGTLRQVFISLTPPFPPYTLYTCTQYTYAHREVGRWGWGELNQREVIRATAHKLGRKYQHDRPYLHTMKSNKQLPQSPLTGQFLDGDVLHCLLWVLSFYGAMHRYWCHLFKEILKTGALNGSMKPFLERFRKMLTKIWEYCICVHKSGIIVVAVAGSRKATAQQPSSTTVVNYPPAVVALHLYYTQPTLSSCWCSVSQSVWWFYFGIIVLMGYAV